MKPLFLCYSKCGTCTKASKWLKANDIEVESRDITVDNPTLEEITTWFDQSGLTINKMFNTSGVKYRELGVKDLLKTNTLEQSLELLSSDGKLVKRPILVHRGKVLVGFKEQEYQELFKL
ncbi:MAG: arsenate reductase family protein [Rikenellaceae bacterium]